MIRVVDVRGLRTPEQRAGVAYVGRRWAGWPKHPLANPFNVYPARTRPGVWRTEAELEADRRVGREQCLARYRSWLLARPTLETDLARLWEECGHGEKALGCWCTTASAGDGSPVVCHAQILAAMLAERFVGTGPGSRAFADIVLDGENAAWLEEFMRSMGR